MVSILRHHFEAKFDTLLYALQLIQELHPLDDLWNIGSFRSVFNIMKFGIEIHTH